MPHITYKPSYLYASEESRKAVAVKPLPKQNKLRKRISFTNMDEHISNRSEEDIEKRPAKKARETKLVSILRNPLLSLSPGTFCTAKFYVIFGPTLNLYTFQDEYIFICL